MSFVRGLIQLICGRESPGNGGPATPPPKPATPILDQFDAIAAGGGSPQEIALRQAGFVRGQIRDNALPFFRELRDHRPIMPAGPIWLVSRFRDVEEILHRETVFGVPYLPNMTGVIGPFVLSQDITPQYDHDISAMRLAIRREDLPRVHGIVSRHAAQIVDELVATGQPFDIVQSLTRIVPLRVAQEYFGFEAPDDDMKRWARAAFEEFFVNLDKVPAVREAAVQAGAESRDALAGLIARRRASGEERDDVLGRLLAQQKAGGGLCFDDEGVIRTLQGCLIGMDETTNQACNAALLVMLSQPPLLAAAQAAAKAGEDEKLAAIVFEALRFRPINPLVVRVLKQPYTLGAGTPHETALPAGAVVFNLTWSAMFDERVLETPTEFKPGRPASHYLHFATGHHACFGRYISMVQIPQILKPLLAQDGLKLAGAPEMAGHLKVFPDKVTVAVGG
ncbi:MAG: cytochrome P450 [Alphaproteobacteria bacterium]|nr:cytochrome P450 [Alphaproteobacteria bacterium]